MCGRCKNCRGCAQRVTPPDTMRSGSFPYEVRGNDYAVNGTHSVSTLDARFRSQHANPATNQAESGVVMPDADTNAIRRSLPRLVRQMGPIPYGHKFGNQIGVTLVKNAHAAPLFAYSGYEGIMPLTQQPKIAKPLPYK
jgi:hypothetical protein